MGDFLLCSRRAEDLSGERLARALDLDMDLVKELAKLPNNELNLRTLSEDM